MEFSVAEVKTAYALSQERRVKGVRSSQDGAARRGRSAIFTEWGLLKQKVSPPLLSQKEDVQGRGLEIVILKIKKINEATIICLPYPPPSKKVVKLTHK